MNNKSKRKMKRISTFLLIDIIILIILDLFLALVARFSNHMYKKFLCDRKK